MPEDPSTEAPAILDDAASPRRGQKVLNSLDDLIAYAELGDPHDLTDWVTADMDLDAELIEDDEGVTLSIGRYGFLLHFPMTIDDFWEQVHEAESAAIAELEQDTSLGWMKPVPTAGEPRE